jgi:hypothetical protein
VHPVAIDSINVVTSFSFPSAVIASSSFYAQEVLDLSMIL